MTVGVKAGCRLVLDLSCSQEQVAMVGIDDTTGGDHEVQNGRQQSLGIAGGKRPRVDTADKMGEGECTHYAVFVPQESIGQLDGRWLMLRLVWCR